MTAAIHCNTNKRIRPLMGAAQSGCYKLQCHRRTEAHFGRALRRLDRVTTPGAIDWLTKILAGDETGFWGLMMALSISN